jgi:acetyltransferase-like isoleucine patch superfamily enzyme
MENYLYYDAEKNIQIVSGEIGGLEEIEFGNNIYIGPQCFITAIGGLTLGNDVIIGPKITIMTANHNYENAGYLPYDEVIVMKKVTIKDNVWIGANVSIVPGVTIGEGAVIGMGAVVTKDIPNCAIAAGNPAKIIKYREIEHYNRLKSEKKSYLTAKKNGLITWKKIDGCNK